MCRCYVTSNCSDISISFFRFGIYFDTAMMWKCRNCCLIQFCDAILLMFVCLFVCLFLFYFILFYFTNKKTVLNMKVHKILEVVVFE